MAWMLKRLNSLAFVVALTVSGTAGAASLDLNLSDDAAEFKFATHSPLEGDAVLETQFSWLHEQSTSDGNSDVVALGLHMVDDATPGGTDFRVGIGGRVLAMEAGDVLDGTALAVGGYFRYTIPNMNRIGVGGELYHAPSIVSGGDLERYTQWAVRGEYQILRQANVYLGYRRVRPDFGGGAVTLESGLHLGLRLNF